MVEHGTENLGVASPILALGTMYYVYVLICRDNNFYTGYTSNLKIRFSQHKEGRVKSTSRRLPIRLVYYEAYLFKEDAKRNEKYYKTWKGKKDLRKKLKVVLSKER